MTTWLRAQLRRNLLTLSGAFDTWADDVNAWASSIGPGYSLWDQPYVASTSVVTAPVALAWFTSDGDPTTLRNNLGVLAAQWSDHGFGVDVDKVTIVDGAPSDPQAEADALGSSGNPFAALWHAITAALGTAAVVVVLLLLLWGAWEFGVFKRGRA